MLKVHGLKWLFNLKLFIDEKLKGQSILFGFFQVLYQSDQFLDKNKDYVVPEHQDLLSASKCSFVAGLFSPHPEETAKSSKFSSIGSRFKVLYVMDLHILLNDFLEISF